jgi:hypothetical protein
VKRPRTRTLTRLLQLLAAAVLALSSGCGGQSGVEGDRPGPPCAVNQTFVVGRIEDVSGGCVSVRVERVLAAGEPVYDGNGEVIFDGNPKIGDVLRGHLGSTYAYTHEFEAAASVALFVETFDDVPALQLFPLQGDRVQLHWAGKLLEVGFTDMTAPDCYDRLEGLYEAGKKDGRSSVGRSMVTARPAPSDDPVCKP